MLAMCGLRCNECPANRAMLTDDDELRKNTALQWSQMYGADIKPESVNCVGCTGKDEGPRFSHCDNCEIRACGLKRGVDNCAQCSEYPCLKLTELFTYAPEAKVNLDTERTRAS